MKTKNEEIPIETLFATLLNDYKKLKVELGKKESYIEELLCKIESLKKEYSNRIEKNNNKSEKKIRELKIRLRHEHELLTWQRKVCEELRNV